MPKKKKWVIPQLAVLVRSYQGERVLSACKTGFAGGPGDTHGPSCAVGAFGCVQCDEYDPGT